MIKNLIPELAAPEYSALTDQQAADLLNAVNIDYEVGALMSGDIYNALDPAEFSGLPDAKKQLVRDILSLGEVSVSTGTNARAVLLSCFGSGTTTRTNLVGLVARQRSRAHEININRTVLAVHVAEART